MSSRLPEFYAKSCVYLGTGHDARQPPRAGSPQCVFASLHCRLTDAHRAQWLAQAVTVDVTRAQIESHTAFHAVVVYPTVKTCNHPWHAVLTLFTCGLWVVVWLLDWGFRRAPRTVQVTRFRIPLTPATPTSVVPTSSSAGSSQRQPWCILSQSPSVEKSDKCSQACSGVIDRLRDNFEFGHLRMVLGHDCCQPSINFCHRN